MLASAFTAIPAIGGRPCRLQLRGTSREARASHRLYNVSGIRIRVVWSPAMKRGWATNPSRFLEYAHGKFVEGDWDERQDGQPVSQSASSVNPRGMGCWVEHWAAES